MWKHNMRQQCDTKVTSCTLCETMWGGCHPASLSFLPWRHAYQKFIRSSFSLVWLWQLHYSYLCTLFAEGCWNWSSGLVHVSECQCKLSGIMWKNISQWQMYRELSPDTAAASDPHGSFTASSCFPQKKLKKPTLHCTIPALDRHSKQLLNIVE